MGRWSDGGGWTSCISLFVSFCPMWTQKTDRCLWRPCRLTAPYLAGLKRNPVMVWSWYGQLPHLGAWPVWWPLAHTPPLEAVRRICWVGRLCPRPSQEEGAGRAFPTVWRQHSQDGELPGLREGSLSAEVTQRAHKYEREVNRALPTETILGQHRGPS